MTDLQVPPHQCINEERIRGLETRNAETGVYLKIIREDLIGVNSKLDKMAEARAAPLDAQTASTWAPVVKKGLEVLFYAIAILGVIAGAKEFLLK